VAKKSKVESEKQGDIPASGVAGNTSKPAAPPAKKPRPTAKKPKAKKAAGKEKTSKTTAVGPAAKPAATASAPKEPSDEAIRLRAYFLAERRARLSLPGDSAHDWIEARRQLLEEAGRGA
jgi:hypothetical protein